jgi:hypothetical protein
MGQTALTVLAPLKLPRPETTGGAPTPEHVARVRDMIRDKKVDAAKLGRALDRARRERQAADCDDAPRSPQVAAKTPESELFALLSERVVHYMSFFIVDDPQDPSWAYVGLEVISDLHVCRVRRLLRKLAADCLTKLFTGCEDFDPNALVGFLRRKRKCAEAFYVAYPGRTVKQIHAESRLRHDLRRDFLKLSQDAALDRTLTTQSDPTSPRKRGGDSAPLLAPSSASIRWEYLRKQYEHKQYREDDLVQCTRPWYVRWSLVKGGARERLRFWASWLLTLAAVGALILGAVVSWHVPAGVLAWHGFCGPRTETNAFWDRWPATAVIAAGVVALVLWIVVFFWLHFGPKKLTAAGFWTAARSALVAWTTVSLEVVLALGAIALVIHSGVCVAHMRVDATLILALVGGTGLMMHRLGVSPAFSAAFWLSILDIAWTLHLRDPQSFPPATLACALETGVIGLWGLVVLVLTASSFFVTDGLFGIFLGIFLVVVPTLVLSFLEPEVARRLAKYLQDCHLPIWPPIAFVAEARALPRVVTFLLTSFFIAAVACIRFACCVYQVRRAEDDENAHAQADPVPSVPQLDELTKNEDRTLQNHLIVSAKVKTDHRRIRTLRRVLRAVGLLARVYFVRGDLGFIQTIHFAQFLILDKPNPKRLILLSNYDGGYASYLGEFSDVTGLTAVFSNCQGFPAAFGLVLDGGRDEQRFVQFGRLNGLPSLGWYSAYPRLTVQDIDTATTIREALRRRIDNPSTLCGQLREHYCEPLLEAECDTLLRKL